MILYWLAFQGLLFFQVEGRLVSVRERRRLGAIPQKKFYAIAVSIGRRAVEWRPPEVVLDRGVDTVV